SMCAASNELANYLTQGVNERLAYDWEKTRYILSFGAGLIESFVPTAMMLRVFGHMRAGAPGRRAKIVQIEPRQGVTAARADEWVSVRAGTDAALALGLAHVIVRDRLYDKAFVANRTLGFEKWTDASGVAHRGFKELVLEEYPPEKVAGLTGVPKEVIERLAHEFAGNQPGFAVSGRGAAAHSNGLYTCTAIHALNALVGSIERPGGVMAQKPPPFAAWPEPSLDEAATAGLAKPRVDLFGDDAPPFAESHIAGLADRLLSGKPYPLGAVFLYYTNPLFSSPQPERLRAGLEKVPLVVSFSPFMDDSTLHADLVLPDHTYLERWQLDEAQPSVGFPVFGIRRPVVAPLHDTRSTGEVLIQLARAVGGAVGEAFPSSEQDLIKDLVRGVHASGRGSIKEASFEKFWEKLLAVGCWSDGPYAFGEWPRVLATPSGKFELYSQRLEQKLAGVAKRRWPELAPAAAQGALLAELGISARGDLALLPHFEPVRPSASSSEFPFILNSYKTMTHAEGRGGNQPHLQELYGVQFDKAWEPWVELNPADAHKLGVGNGDLVRLRSPAGQLEAKVIVHPGAAAGVANVPFEYGHVAYGRWASGRGESVNGLLHAPQERLVGGIARYDARVAITRV
ncbi:MAG: molybdopterin-containing oxidoreductase family protein, partial [Myxococcaceae bacterium]